MASIEQETESDRIACAEVAAIFEVAAQIKLETTEKKLDPLLKAMRDNLKRAGRSELVSFVETPECVYVAVHPSPGILSSVADKNDCRSECEEAAHVALGLAGPDAERAKSSNRHARVRAALVSTCGGKQKNLTAKFKGTVIDGEPRSRPPPLPTEPKPEREAIAVICGLTSRGRVEVEVDGKIKVACFQDLGSDRVKYAISLIRKLLAVPRPTATLDASGTWQIFVGSPSIINQLEALCESADLAGASGAPPQ